MLVHQGIVNPEVKSDFCELAPRKKFSLDKIARKYVRFMGHRTGFEEIKSNLVYADSDSALFRRRVFVVLVDCLAPECRL